MNPFFVMKNVVNSTIRSGTAYRKVVSQLRKELKVKSFQEGKPTIVGIILFIVRCWIQIINSQN